MSSNIDVSPAIPMRNTNTCIFYWLDKQTARPILHNWLS